MISSLKFEECNKTLVKIYSKADLNKINDLIDTLNIAKVHKDFYKLMIEERFNKIIKYSYDKLNGVNYEK